MPAPARKDWVQRHLAGWPIALALVASGLLSAVLLVPRAVPPRELPLPLIDRREQALREAADAELAREARAEPLPYGVRAIGETLRRLGAIAPHAPEHAQTLKRQLAELARIARAEHGDRALLRLRALQTELFVAAASAAPSPERDRELGELGGDFAARAASAGWYGPEGFVGTKRELAVLYRVRWSDLVGVLGVAPFAPTLNEWRIYYRFLIANPAERRDGRADERMAHLNALARLDADYPLQLARGVVLYTQGAYGEAAGAFAAHLAAHPDGPWTLRVKNHLAACGAELTPESTLH